jgi:PKD repeat protein
VSDEATPITFDASGSYDPDGDALQYRWDFDNDGAWDTDWSTTPVVSYTWNDDWAGTAKLEVSDGEFTATDIVRVTVNNVAPAVEAGLDQEITAGDAVSFSGGFTDPGWLDTHAATWDFGDGVSQAGVLSEENNPPAAAGNVAGSHIYYDRGTYTVTLTVYDDDGGIGTDTLTVTVKPVPTTVNCEPDTLSLKGKGRWITVYIEFPDGYDVSRIDIDSVKLNYRVPAEADTKYGFVRNPEIADRDGDGLPELTVKFDREAVKQILQPGEAVIAVSGKVSHHGGLADFEGMAAISVSN